MKDDSGNHAVYADRGASALHMTAATVLVVISRLCGNPHTIPPHVPFTVAVPRSLRSKGIVGSTEDHTPRQNPKQIVDHSEAKRADLAEAEKSLAALMTSQAVSKSSYTQVASDHEASGRVFADELKTLAEATQVLQSKTGGADGQTYSLSRKIQLLLCRHRQISKDSIW